MHDKSSMTCPHCEVGLLRFSLPEAGFDHEYDWACFNDDCPYFVRGRTWMSEQFGVSSSYRHRVDGKTGHASPLAVWSPTALRDRILPDEDSPSAGQQEQS